MTDLTRPSSPDVDDCVDKHPTFKARCMAILDNWTTNTRNEAFDEVLSMKTSKEWATELWRHATPELRDLLDQPDAPTNEDLVKLAKTWVDTREWGAYACLLEPPNEEHHWHVYSGSATRSRGGLKARRLEHLNPRVKETERNYFHNLMHQTSVDREPHFLTLVTAENDISRPVEEWRYTRALCMIAEGLFGIWLGAFKEGCHEELFELCPFPIDSLGRRGTCSHSPLTEPLHTPIDAEKAKARSKEYFSEYYQKMKSTMTAEETEEYKRKAREATRRYRASRTKEEKEEIAKKRKIYRSKPETRQQEREYAAGYNAKDEVKERKKEWWAENPDKRQQYNEKSRAKRAKR